MKEWAVRAEDCQLTIKADRAVVRDGALTFWDLASEDRKADTIAVFAPGGWTRYVLLRSDA